MKKTRILIEMAEITERNERLEIEAEEGIDSFEEILSYDETGIDASEDYMGEYYEPIDSKWERILDKIENAETFSIQELAMKVYEYYIKGELGECEAEEWIYILKWIIGFNNEMEE